MSSCPVLHFYQVPSKYSEGYSSYRADKKSISNKTKGDNFQKTPGPVVYLLYISTKYHKNIRKGVDMKSMDTHWQI